MLPEAQKGRVLEHRSRRALDLGAEVRAAPLVVLLHGRGSSEQEIIGTRRAPRRRPFGRRGPIADRGERRLRLVGQTRHRPSRRRVARVTIACYRAWLDEVAPVGRPVVLVGFSGGAAFAGDLLLQEPEPFAGGRDPLRPTTGRLRGTRVRAPRPERAQPHRAAPRAPRRLDLLQRRGLVADGAQRPADPAGRRAAAPRGRAPRGVVDDPQEAVVAEQPASVQDALFARLPEVTSRQSAIPVPGLPCARGRRSNPASSRAWQRESASKVSQITAGKE